MANVAYVTMSQPEKAHFNVSIRIHEDDAVCSFDAGLTEIIWISFPRTLFELRAYRQMGYQLKFDHIRI